MMLNYPATHLMVASSPLNMWRGLLYYSLIPVYHNLKHWLLRAENFIGNMPHILCWNLHDLIFTVMCLLCLFVYINYSFVQHSCTCCVVRNLVIKTSSFHGKHCRHSATLQYLFLRNHFKTPNLSPTLPPRINLSNTLPSLTFSPLRS